MKLLRFRIHKFKSLIDSGWINCDSLTTFIGENEAGKTSIITALWKLNPSSGGEIDLLRDLPRNQYSELKNMERHHVFIEAEFELSDDMVEKIYAEENLDVEKIRIVRVSRDFDGNYYVMFPGLFKPGQYDTEMSDDVSVVAKTDLRNDRLKGFILENMPKFIFYSNYGNLDTEIYLPQVVESFNRSNLSEHAMARRKTLQVLFEYIGINPSEILRLSKDDESSSPASGGGFWGKKQQQQPQVKESFKEVTDRKTEYKILLNAASARLTKEFNSWWNQTTYDFDLQFDGKYLKIWVADHRRGTKMELESRSTGLQWFLSFFLIFTVEQRYSQSNSILLLDEAGISLHPSAQADLYNFVKDLSKTNQILNNTHSPYLADISFAHLLKIVYIDKTGNTRISQDFKINIDRSNERSMSALKSALYISISQPILNGSTCIIVPTLADQNYLIGIKNYLIANKKINPIEDIIFLPLSHKSIWPMAQMLYSINGKLPTVLLNSDEDSTDVMQALRSTIYRNKEHMVFSYGDLLSGVTNPCIEDFISYPVLKFAIGRIYKDLTENIFEVVYKPSQQITQQIREFALSNYLDLPNDWKSSLSVTTKQLLQNQLITKPTIDEETVKSWKALFNMFIENK